jgi:hypothetical protein
LPPARKAGFGVGNVRHRKYMSKQYSSRDRARHYLGDHHFLILG